MDLDNDLTRARYLRTSQLTKMYSLSRSTIWRYLNEMQRSKQYRKSVIVLNKNLRIVRAADFDNYLRNRNYIYLKT